MIVSTSFPEQAIPTGSGSSSIEWLPGDSVETEPSRNARADHSHRIGLQLRRTAPQNSMETEPSRAATPRLAAARPLPQQQRPCLCHCASYRSPREPKSNARSLSGWRGEKPRRSLQQSRLLKAGSCIVSTHAAVTGEDASGGMRCTCSASIGADCKYEAAVL